MVARTASTMRAAEHLRSALGIERLLAMGARYGATGMHQPMFLNELARTRPASFAPASLRIVFVNRILPAHISSANQIRLFAEM